MNEDGMEDDERRGVEALTFCGTVCVVFVWCVFMTECRAGVLAMMTV